MPRPDKPEPEFFVGRAERSRGGAMRVGTLHRVAEQLLHGGFALLPSDTSYSVATIPISGTIRTKVNKLLHRANWPVSVAFPSLPSVRPWIAPNATVERLLREFCPGPITVVCSASAEEPDEFFSAAVRSEDRTVGVRIPDSIVEREIAAMIRYPITTVAVRDPRSLEVVTSFETALEIVARGIHSIGGEPWCAIEGDIFYSRQSTVVRTVGATEDIVLIREGDIPFPEIQERIRVRDEHGD
jgi:L-threonylcarbamoyladenylate synthase